MKARGYDYAFRLIAFLRSGYFNFQGKSQSPLLPGWCCITWVDWRRRPFVIRGGRGELRFPRLRG
jgi:hypothetical protein